SASRGSLDQRAGFGYDPAELRDAFSAASARGGDPRATGARAERSGRRRCAPAPAGSDPGKSGLRVRRSPISAIDRRPMSESDPPSAPRHPVAAPRGVRHVMAVGGGRGGVGKSVLAVNLAVCLAQLGRRVALVDADPAGAVLHTMLGLELPLPKRDEADDDDAEPIATPVPGLLLLPQAYTVGSTSPVRPGRKARWARGLRYLDVDYVLLDLGAGTLPATLDLFLMADLGICVASPEPP